ncbi:alkaline phosphatase PhoX [Streptomyces catenulae]|uniref:Alkaline phosphatase PhoX n=1 Tax=Streptomyces catenulae TaxID=66875 RepID=A0ABV2Z7B1_9ACTN|nr:alkaline phosphatase PhoX [Streptomyces catenulae]
MPLTRRDLATRSAATGAGGAPAGSAGGLAAAPVAVAAGAGPATGAAAHGPGPGPLVPDPDGILALPAGFAYRLVTRADGTTPDSGEPTHHGGTGAFAGPPAATPLVDNHASQSPRNDRPHPVPPAEEPVHEPAAAGGRTAVEVAPDGTPIGERVGLAGTSAHRAGGVTPWGTWLTCEKTEGRAGRRGMPRDHGHVFESDPHDLAEGRDPRPLKALGRFTHGAVAVDPRRGHLYLTEDADTPDGLFHRWTPPPGFHHGRGRLRTLAADAGVLAAARCYDSGGRFVAALSRVTRPGTVYGVDWIEVPDRDARTVPVREQFDDGEITRAGKPEGMWWADGGAYLVFSRARGEGPGRRDGQVWFHDPSCRTLTLTLRFGVTPGPGRNGASDGPGAPPHGGPVITEDGESTGRAFSPDGRTLFIPLQEPGLMAAVTGPWHRQNRPGHRR